MAKPLGIALGVVGAKAPLPPEAIIEHAKPLQESKPRRQRKTSQPETPEPSPAVEPVVVCPMPVAVDAGPTIELTVPADAES